MEHFGDHARLDERQIALYVDQDLARQVVCNLRDAIGARPVCSLGHPDDAAKALDCGGNPFIVRRNDHGVDPACVGRAAIDVLDHRTARDLSERLARKSRRGESGGDDSDSAKGRRSQERIEKRNRGHGE